MDTEAALTWRKFFIAVIVTVAISCLYMLVGALGNHNEQIRINSQSRVVLI